MAAAFTASSLKDLNTKNQRSEYQKSGPNIRLSLCPISLAYQESKRSMAKSTKGMAALSVAVEFHRNCSGSTMEQLLSATLAKQWSEW
eukprot:scaffold224593_cov17-Tisochrysis_lutea.AAC.1